ncbi:hypothetical protein WSM22_09720 [Cytophagales bacterium WSM2-2]|nr:hypothetical protein WSM22_09720 [Cytophagales bacterium WSM2-2]
MENKPSLKELGFDLLNLTRFQLIVTITLPFVFIAFYFLFAINGYWVPAVISTMALTFISYGSTSHDLVHENLKLNKKLNSILLSVLELLCFRSGHAYQLSHLYHHKRYPHEDDVEGAAARMSLIRSLLEGVIFQFKIYFWAVSMSKNRSQRFVIILEGVMIFILATVCIASFKYSYAGIVYLCLMTAGSWIIPLATSYAVHTPDESDELHQTRLFRGKFFSTISFHHLYHLEHHLYPMVPHMNWPLLAKRLDDYFSSQQITPMIFPTNNSHG